MVASLSQTFILQVPWPGNCYSYVLGKAGGAMQILSREKSKVLAEQHGWSLTIAEGYVDGEACRRRGKAPPAHALVGMDEYSEGFRAGYYLRNPDSTRSDSRNRPLPTGASVTGEEFTA